MLIIRSFIVVFFRNIAINNPVNVLIAFGAHVLLVCMLAGIGNFTFDMAPITNFPYHVMW